MNEGIVTNYCYYCNISLPLLLPLLDIDGKHVVKTALKEFFEEKEQRTIAISEVTGKFIQSLLVNLGNIRRFPKKFQPPSDENIGKI